MGRYLIIDTEKMNYRSDYGEASMPITTISTNCILSPEETEAIFKSVWNTADERCCDEWENKEYGSGGDSDKLDWEQFKLTL